MNRHLFALFDMLLVRLATLEVQLGNDLFVSGNHEYNPL